MVWERERGLKTEKLTFSADALPQLLRILDLGCVILEEVYVDVAVRSGFIGVTS